MTYPKKKDLEKYDGRFRDGYACRDAEWTAYLQEVMSEERIIKTIIQCRESKIINNRRLVIYNEADLEKIAKALREMVGL